MVRPESIAEVMGGTAILGRRVRSISDLVSGNLRSIGA